MKSIPTFISMVAVLAAAAVSFPLQRIKGHWFLFVYLVIQFVYATMLFLYLQREDRSSAGYKKWFAIVSLAAICASWALAFRWLSYLPVLSMYVASVVSLAFVVGVVFYLGTLLPQFTHFYLLLGGAFLFPGALSVLTVVQNLGKDDTIVRLALPAFWILFAGYCFASASSLKNKNFEFLPQASWIPSVIAFVCFGLLAFGLSRPPQYETSRASVQPDIVQEVGR